jgi:hypothetical protein
VFLLTAEATTVTLPRFLRRVSTAPAGLGCLVDASDDDEYTANGPGFPSVYGTPAVFAGVSQGSASGYVTIPLAAQEHSMISRGMIATSSENSDRGPATIRG